MSENMEEKKKVGRIAYLLENFLTSSITFITHEIQYIYNDGYDIQVYVAGSCVPSEIDPVVADLLKIAQFSRPVRAKEIILSHLRALLDFPTKYISTLWEILRLTWNKPGACIRSVWNFIEGIYLGKKMVDRGIVWIHTHFAGRAATTTWSIWRVYGIPYSVTTHAYDLFANVNDQYIHQPYHAILSRKKSGSLLKLKLEDAQVIVTVSEFNHQYMTEKLKIGEEKIRIVRCGVNISRFQKLTKPHNVRPAILSVGTLDEKKGHGVLIRACAYLKEWGYQFSCKIIGEGPFLHSLLATRESLHLGGDVELCGLVHHSELTKYYKEADVFVLACVKGRNGNMDGIPVVLMEAMAMEIPVVTTKLSGIPELVESGLTGFLVEPGDAKALAEKMAQLLDDCQLRQNIGRCGREKVLQDYDQAKNHALMADILFKAMKRMRVSPLLRQEEGRTVRESAATVEA